MPIPKTMRAFGITSVVEDMNSIRGIFIFLSNLLSLNCFGSIFNLALGIKARILSAFLFYKKYENLDFYVRNFFGNQIGDFSRKSVL